MRYSELFENDLSQLSKYIRHGHHIGNGYVVDLARRYPHDGGKLYRGLHFDTQNQYDAFMESIADGTLTTGRPSSWTLSEDVASSFSKMKMTYEPNMAIMKADQARSEAGDHMTGFEGIVLETTVEAGLGLDTNKTGIGGEAEILLPAGTYEVGIVQNSLPYNRQYDTLEKIEAIIASAVSAKDKDDRIEYVLRSWFPKLSHEKKALLADWVHKEQITATDDELVAERKYDYFGKTTCNLYANLYFDQRLFPYMSQNGKLALERQARKATKKIANIISQYTDEEIIGTRYLGNDSLQALNPDYNKDMKKAARRISQLYHSLNTSRSVTREEMHELVDKFKSVLELLHKCI